jgi:DNA topoisomerase IB
MGAQRSLRATPAPRAKPAGPVRVGNEKYAHDNDSYGLTTLRTRHATVGRDGVKLSFRGKSGKRWQATLRSRKLAEVVRRSRKLPGRQLFKYLARARRRRPRGLSVDEQAVISLLESLGRGAL